MPDHEDWLLRPVVKGMCKYESLLDGTLDIVDIAKMNDALNVIADNEALIEKHRNENK